MPLSERYQRQVALLIAAMPFVAAEKDFALKGGTAINLFVRDMPRLSVDIDLTYLPVAGRPESLAAINAAMKRMAAAIRAGLRDARVTESMNEREQVVTKLVVQRADVQIKIEVTPVLRGCVFAPEPRAVSPAVEDAFGYAETQVVSFADLYAGKIMAALDRQHPRDLYDIRDLLANEGITEDLRRAFLVYLVSHDRPMSEVLAPRRKNLAQEFSQAFAGMTAEPVPLEELEAAREALIATITGAMPEEHKQFLTGFKRGTPDWGSIGLPEAADLPAVKWKQLNLDKLPEAARTRFIDQLIAALARGGVAAED
ncbi:putative nucleotidyltransferase component of viral defense system [Azospirillum fermentarium]|uniref:nucleotidyl transferase AbiEii/AbiGii toxin family protein n=1 Tax=Azospirillum fermentarium TaxID=1233114 RepID=UPI002226CB45|nr:nucleotidyl transferase AbiEii/AbiGii toxin family protein [Azospirillum fermentarium]MCW2247866.1 putative nucleotidyltransferase component of viral defense system [Azospirillum fermentarium]